MSVYHRVPKAKTSRTSDGWHGSSPEDVASQANVRLVWLPPLVRSAGETVAAAIRRGVRAGGEATVRVTAAGEVIPPRGPYVVAGELLAEL